MQQRPNILLIMADNLGAWPLGCYGNAEFRTPNLDRLAAAGVRFNRAFCVNPVCSPNRATLFTGLMPSQHGVHNFLGSEKPDAQNGPDAYCTVAEFPVLSQLLADAGYDCGLFGKWHLGDSKTPQCGFRDWLSLTRGHTPNFFKNDYYRDGEQQTETGYYPDLVTELAARFITHKRNAPFFCYVPSNLPYGLNRTLEHGHPGGENYTNEQLTTCPRGQNHPWQDHLQMLFESDLARPGYAAQVESFDKQVGDLLAAVDKAGQRDNTLVVVTADHGLLAGQHGLWGMADHARPCAMFQENLRIPLIIAHAGRIAPDVVNDKVSHYDLYHTLLDYVGLAAPAEHVAKSPGRSITPALRNQPLAPRQFVLNEYEHVRVIQDDRFKYVHRHPAGPHELYDLQNDPGETNNLFDSDDAAAELARMQQALADEFSKYVDPEYDLWNEGRSKAGRIPHPHGASV